MFLQQTSWLYSESGHSSGPHFRWWTKGSQSFVLRRVKNISFLRALYLIPSKLLHHSSAVRLHSPRVHVMSRHWVLCKARCITFFVNDDIHIKMHCLHKYSAYIHGCKLGCLLFSMVLLLWCFSYSTLVSFCLIRMAMKVNTRFKVKLYCHYTRWDWTVKCSCSPVHATHTNFIDTTEKLN